MSDTPETDAEHARMRMGGFTLDFCRKLERERDELRDILRKLLEIIPEPECHDFGHTKEERHTFLEECPVMARYDALITKAREAAK